MLKHLHIQNYALISHLDIDFADGFSVLTGETGAGKSIILGALSLVLGARADNKVITDGEDKCVIEAEFDDCIVRRELYTNGKSRSFVDDALVTLQELKGLATRLVDIHSQHANLLLENADFQLSILDSIAQNESLVTDYSAKFAKYIEATKALEGLQELARKSQQDADYIQYRYKLLDEAQLVSGELEQLEEEQYQLSHAEELRELLANAINALDGDGEGVISVLRSCKLDSVSTELQERIESARLELQDIRQEAERKLDHIEMDPERLQVVEERMDSLNGLLHKFNAKDIDELIVLRDELAEQVHRMDSFDYDIAQAQKDVDSARKTLTEASHALTESRKSVVEQITTRLVSNLKQLGIPHAKIEFAISPTEDFTPTGCDEVRILFAANLNQTLRDVSEVASGGEISRLMLCIKSLIATTKDLPTIIFDEIDTGVSGDIAAKMASIMREMATARQIIAITHLPQIAALGQTQYKVYKLDTTQRTETHIRQLSEEERVNEIASMLSGAKTTEAAIATAKELLDTRL